MLKNFSNEVFPVSGVVKLFPLKAGWYYLTVPKEYTQITKDLAVRGLVAITATCGNSSWNTSLLPLGNGTQFIALPAKVRSAENITHGNKISLSFILRER